MSTSTNKHDESASPKSRALALFIVWAMLGVGLFAMAPAAEAAPKRNSDPGTVEGMWGTDVAKAIGAYDLWESGYTGQGIDVAVIDTGVSPVAGLDQPGKIIDGPDFSFSSGQANLRHLDVHGHGTAMASLVAATPTFDHAVLTDTLRAMDASGQPVGTAPGARIVNIKVGDPVGAVDVSQVIAGIDWAVQNRNANGMNIRVLLVAFDTDSVQSYQVDPLSFAVENAWRHGIVVVVAAGNDGRSANTLGNPATNPYVLAVSAAAPNSTGWKVPSWGSKGDGVRNPDVLVPGEAILASAVPGSALQAQNPSAIFDTPHGLMIRGSGTSQAAASAAGAVALLLEARPELTPDEVKQALNSTAQDLSSKGRNGSFIDEKIQGHGLLQLHLALDSQPAGATQTHLPATGFGSLELSRGSYHVGPQLVGEITAFGDVWNDPAWVAATSAGTAFTGQQWQGDRWVAGSWLDSVFDGSSWDGSAWSAQGTTWSSVTWSGVTWSGVTWSGVTWSGVTWSGVTWSSVTWSSVTWSGVSWS